MDSAPSAAWKWYFLQLMGSSQKSKTRICRSYWLVTHGSCSNNLELVSWWQTYRAFNTTHAFSDGGNTWFFPFNIRRLVTLPKGKPKEMTSASVTSLGSLRTWITRDGIPALLLSPLNFLLSFPLAVRSNSYCWWKGAGRRSTHFLLLTHRLCSPASYCTITEKFHTLS